MFFLTNESKMLCNELMCRIKKTVTAVLVGTGFASILAVHTAAAEILESVPEISISILTPDVSAFDGSEPIYFEFVLQNSGDDTIYFLPWNTPFETEFSGPAIRIYLLPNGPEDEIRYELPYEGKVINYGAPELEDYIIIAPGEQLTNAVDVSEYFDLISVGEYALEVDTAIQNIKRGKDFGNDFGHLTDEEQFDALFLKSEPRIFRIKTDSLIIERGEREFDDKELPFNKFEQRDDRFGDQPSFTQCNNGEKVIAGLAYQESTGSVSSALNHLNSFANGGKRFKTWFGNYTRQNYSSALAKFTNIHSILRRQNLNLVCECNIKNPERAFAYVRPNNPRKVWLCPKFWQAPQHGMKSQRSTFVHEISHFYVAASTRDLFIGISHARELAKLRPQKALQNAENFEFFSENTP